MHPKNRDVGRCTLLSFHLDASSALNVSAGGSGNINKEGNYPDKDMVSSVDRGRKKQALKSKVWIIIKAKKLLSVYVTTYYDIRLNVIFRLSRFVEHIFSKTTLGTMLAGQMNVV